MTANLKHPKNDILNYEEQLSALVDPRRQNPALPPWQRDGEDILFNLWESAPESDGGKAAELIREVFLTRASLAHWIGGSIRQLERLAQNPTIDIIDEWESRPDSPSERLCDAWTIRKACQWLLVEENVPEEKRKLLCRPGEWAILRVEVAKLRDDYSRWLQPRGRRVTLMLGTMLALARNDYSCWTDQWRWPEESV